MSLTSGFSAAETRNPNPNPNGESELTLNNSTRTSKTTTIRTLMIVLAGLASFRNLSLNPSLSPILPESDSESEEEESSVHQPDIPPQVQMVQEKSRKAQIVPHQIA